MMVSIKFAIIDNDLDKWENPIDTIIRSHYYLEVMILEATGIRALIQEILANVQEEGFLILWYTFIGTLTGHIYVYCKLVKVNK